MVAAAAVIQIWCFAMIVAALAILLRVVDQNRADDTARFVFIDLGLLAVVLFLILAIAGKLIRRD